MNISLPRYAEDVRLAWISDFPARWRSSSLAGDVEQYLDTEFPQSWNWEGYVLA